MMRNKKFEMMRNAGVAFRQEANEMPKEKGAVPYSLKTLVA
jgi:hypothetical protein